MSIASMTPLPIGIIKFVNLWKYTKNVANDEISKEKKTHKNKFESSEKRWGN